MLHCTVSCNEQSYWLPANKSLAQNISKIKINKSKWFNVKIKMNQGKTQKGQKGWNSTLLKEYKQSSTEKLALYYYLCNINVNSKFNQKQRNEWDWLPSLICKPVIQNLSSIWSTSWEFSKTCIANLKKNVSDIWNLNKSINEWVWHDDTKWYICCCSGNNY